ncbi:hypothetical protein AVEN_104110-1 [Araneus ventricosus]|uniref:Uncharacterized protein n=1 Tax=Araneus ventricosus TaxID=182803 RepID=A0A4Y2J993_ARAVE|nr:hypothetical protein AVEN_104110-1 [Araneus ventricosus]
MVTSGQRKDIKQAEKSLESTPHFTKVGQIFVPTTFKVRTFPKGCRQYHQLSDSEEGGGSGQWQIFPASTPGKTFVTADCAEGGRRSRFNAGERNNSEVMGVKIGGSNCGSISPDT